MTIMSSGSELGSAATRPDRRRYFRAYVQQYNAMKLNATLFALLLLATFTTTAIAQDNDPYPLGPDYKPQAGVPKGEVLQFTFEKSRIFPGTLRDYWVYVPAQYTPDKPACLYVNQDGIQWNAPTVFDNLIAKKEMPVTIGVFIDRVTVGTGERVAWPWASFERPRFLSVRKLTHTRCT